MSWEYRMCREATGDPADPCYLYSLREVYYDDNGAMRWFSAEPTTFVGDTPLEVIESLHRALGSFPAKPVLDLDTREDIHLTLAGLPKGGAS